MSKQLARLVVKLEAQSAKFQKELEKTRKDANQWRKKVSGDIGIVKKAFVALAGVYSVNQAASFYKEHADGIDKLAKQSDKLGITTEALQGLRHAGELTGVGINTMDMAIQRQTRRVAEAAKGYGEAAGALKELNLDANTLVKLSPDKQFYEIAEAMQNVKNQGDRVRLAMKLFDSEGVSLVNTLALGKDGLIAAKNEVESFGGSITRIDAAKVEAANDQFYKAGEVVKAIGSRIAIETAPIIGGLSNEFFQAAKESGGMGNVTRKAMDYVASGVGYAGNAVKAFQIIWLQLRKVVSDVVASTIGGFASIVEKGHALLSRFGIDGLGNFAESARGIQDIYLSSSDDMRAKIEEFNQELSKGTPYQKVKAWVEDIRAQSQRAAQETAKGSSGLSNLLMGDIETELNQEKIRISEIERIREAGRKRIAQQELQFQAKILDFQQASSRQKVKTLISEGVQITQGASHTSKRLFKINKALALADAAVTLPSAVLKAVERGGGWPWGYAFGALTLVNGLAQISSIKRSSFGGGTSASFSGSGGGAQQVVDVTPTDVNDIVNQEQNQTNPIGQTNIYINGDTYGLDDFNEKVIGAVAQASNNNRIVVRDNSGRVVLEVA